ncbi:hypothetical protein INT47_008697 [Mucor saturninus]|uniref:Uncharacterized protein n=1 Tax=Mucor saturninus TaxID=64648 RepID=A0A8H7RI60_9FUNG|nr:hypothetical protein INT47_008697 [Mucor saturninus]
MDPRISLRANWVKQRDPLTPCQPKLPVIALFRRVWTYSHLPNREKGVVLSPSVHAGSRKLNRHFALIDSSFIYMDSSVL